MDLSYFDLRTTDRVTIYFYAMSERLFSVYNSIFLSIKINISFACFSKKKKGKKGEMTNE